MRNNVLIYDYAKRKRANLYPQMRKTIWAIVSLILLIGAFKLGTIYPSNASLVNRTNWTLLGNGSEWFWTFMQSLIILVTLIVVYRELRISAATHLLSTLTSLNDRWTSREMVSQRGNICRAYLEGERVLTLGRQNVFTFFEELGLYSKRCWVPEQVIWDTYSYHIECYWDICSDEVLNLRTQSNDPSAFENFEELVERMRAINKERNISFTKRTAKLLREFAKGERG